MNHTVEVWLILIVDVLAVGSKGFVGLQAIFEGNKLVNYQITIFMYWRPISMQSLNKLSHSVFVGMTVWNSYVMDPFFYWTKQQPTALKTSLALFFGIQIENYL